MAYCLHLIVESPYSDSVKGSVRVDSINTLSFSYNSGIVMVPFNVGIEPLAKELPVPVALWDDDLGLDICSNDAFGKPFCFIAAGDLVNYFDSNAFHFAHSPWDRAIVEFIKALPKDTRIIPHWS